MILLVYKATLFWKAHYVRSMHSTCKTIIMFSHFNSNCLCYNAFKWNINKQNILPQLYTSLYKDLIIFKLKIIKYYTLGEW